MASQTSSTGSLDDTSVPAERAGAEGPREIAGWHGEPGWLADLRARAWEAYRSAPLPDRVRHLWRYTDPEQFEPADGTVSRPPAEGGDWPRAIGELLERDHLSAAAFCRGGRLERTYLAPELERAGVVLAGLHEAASGHEETVREHLGRVVGRRHGKFEALNDAVWQGGVFLHVPRNVRVERPIHLAIRPAPEGGFLAPRLLVVIEEGGSATLVDDYIARDGSGGALQVNATAEVVLGQASHLRYVTVQQMGPHAQFYLTNRAHVGRDAKYLNVLASLGGSVTKADVGAVLTGQGAESEMLGLLLGHEGQHFDHHTVHDHRAGHTLSNLDFKVVLQGKARSAYTGLIRIVPGADESEAYQENRNLLLSGEAKAESIPELEILTDEVRCSHGATMGPVDREHIFYLMSRGIPRADALRMVVGGFVEPTLKMLPEDLRERMRGHVSDRLKEL